LFRLTNEVEALTHFHQYSPIINALTHASSSVYDEAMLQSISDAIKANIHWRPAHFAAFVGLYECFHHKNIQWYVQRGDIMYIVLHIEFIENVSYSSCSFVNTNL
jgi:hypothetical protein